MRKPAVVALLPLLFAGCTFGPKYKRPQIQPPASYYAEPQTRENSVADLAWWDLFKDPVLQGLIREAFKRTMTYSWPWLGSSRNEPCLVSAALSIIRKLNMTRAFQERSPSSFPITLITVTASAPFGK